MGKIMYISEEVANQIVTDYKAKIIEELKVEMSEREEPTMEADTLIKVINLLEERNWYRQYTVPEAPPKPQEDKL